MQDYAVVTYVDTLVVSAGVVGFSIASNLVAAGQKVTVVDQAGIGEKASGVNQGQISLLDRSARRELEMAFQSLDAYRAMDVSHGIGLRLAGGLAVLYTDADIDRAEAVVEERRSAGLDCRLVHRRGLAPVEPYLSAETVAGGIHCADEGYLDLFAVIGVFVARIREGGGEVATQEAVTGFETQGGHVSAVHTTRRVIEPQTVVLAADKHILRSIRGMQGTP